MKKELINNYKYLNVFELVVKYLNLECSFLWRYENQKIWVGEKFFKQGEN